MTPELFPEIPDDTTEVDTTPEPQPEPAGDEQNTDYPNGDDITATTDPELAEG